MPADPDLELTVLVAAVSSDFPLPKPSDFTVERWGDLVELLGSGGSGDRSRAAASILRGLPSCQHARAALSAIELAVVELDEARYMGLLAKLRKLAMRRNAITVGLAIAEIAAEDGRPLQCAAMACDLSAYLISEGLEAVSWQASGQ